MSQSPKAAFGRNPPAGGRISECGMNDNDTTPQAPPPKRLWPSREGGPAFPNQQFASSSQRVTTTPTSARRAKNSQTKSLSFFRDCARRKWRGKRRSLSSSSSSSSSAVPCHATFEDENEGRARLPGPIRQPARSAGRRTGGPADCRSARRKGLVSQSPNPPICYLPRASASK